MQYEVYLDVLFLENMMMDFLVRRFIKDYENVENVKVRTAYGMLALMEVFLPVPLPVHY